MGCDIHSVLQKKNNNGEWVTVDTDVLQLSSSAAREFNQLTTGIVNTGFPKDLVIDGSCMVTDPVTQTDYWLGEHSFGYLTVKEFIQIEYPGIDRSLNKIEFEREGSGYIIRVNTPDLEDDGFVTNQIEGILNTFKFYTFYPENYRLILGYDS